MKDGSYNEKINWGMFCVPQPLTDTFNKRALLSKLSRRSNSYVTCGSSALSLLTGLTPRYVESQLPRHPQRLWSTTAAVTFLRKRGFKVRELSKFGVTNLSPNNPSEWQSQPLCEGHVLLCDLLMCRNEASWWVVHNNFSYHNFTIEHLNPLLFCNKPSQGIFMVTHPSWE